MNRILKQRARQLYGSRFGRLLLVFLLHFAYSSATSILPYLFQVQLERQGVNSWASFFASAMVQMVVILLFGPLLLGVCRYVYLLQKERDPGLGDALLAMADALIAAQNVVTAAQALGLGSCYIGDILENRERVKELLALPEYVFPAALLVIGRPTRQQRERPKPERFERRFMVRENRYRSLTGEELRAMFQGRTGMQSFEEWIKAFCQRKYHADFSLEMSRSAQNWLEPFQAEKM